ncbi:hypothetical protein ACIF83_11170 [Streptomyces sp. NPDC085866]|uniref:hypothetical protein n=1 Tax=Streptomyces sp. NPDC085866 TaxID=3365736 RepID=UPI0037CE6064
MTDTARTGWWNLLPAGIRGQVDGYVLQDARLQAVRVVREVGRAHGLGLTEAQTVAHDRYLHHGDRIARTPDSPLDLESLAARAAGCPGRVLAIEAVRDGDTTHDWFVDLLAVTAEPTGEQRLVTIYRSTAVRHLGEHEDHGPLHPSAAATRAGTALAARLSVPFHFASPDRPDDQAPRWRP